MNRTLHSTEIAGNATDVYALIADPTRWPETFPPCRSVTMLNHADLDQRFEISALADGEVRTWTSSRILDRARMSIEFRSTKPIALLSEMRGIWRVTPLEGRCLLQLEHEFQLADRIPESFSQLANTDDALEYMHRVLDKNSGEELASIKHAVENGCGAQPATRDTFFEAVEIDAPADTVYPLLQQLEGWPQLLPHCVAIDVSYDDGENQEFTMTVDTAHGREVIRSLRSCNGQSIRYFQPSPPPVLARHSGEWLVRPQHNGCRVESWHTIELSMPGVKGFWGDISAAEAVRRVRTAINNNSKGTMEAIQQAVTNSGVRKRSA